MDARLASTAVLPPPMPWWRAAINRSGGFLLGFVGFAFVVLAIWRLWIMPVFPETQNLAHAGGALAGQTYVNGLDAFDNSYKNGFRAFEVDFQRTSDLAIVCGHDWDAYNDKPPSLATFLADRAKIKHPPCTMLELAGWFKSHPDTKLLADSKDDVVAINLALRAALGPQLIAEAYDVSDVVNLALVDENEPVLGLYKLGGIPSRYATVMAMHYDPRRLSGIAMSVVDVWYGLALWSKIWVSQPVYVYTVNGCGYAPLLHLFGVDAVMTDQLGPKACQ